MTLTVLSPERTLLQQTGVTAVELPGSLGRFVALRSHAPIITSLTAGVVRYDVEGESRTLGIKGGFAEILDDNVTVCTD